MEIGERIKQCREARGLTQQELAEMVGYTSKTTIGKIETNANKLRQSMILKFAEALNVTPVYLLGWDQDRIDEAIKLKDAELAADFSDEEKIREMLAMMPKENLQQVKLILAYQPSLTELEDLADYVRFLVSKRKDTDGKA